MGCGAGLGGNACEGDGKMKALSIRQPYAYLILIGVKRIENRTWPTLYRGPLAIHAGARWHERPVEQIEKHFRVKVPDDLPTGGIIGVVDLVDVIQQSNDRSFEGPFGSSSRTRARCRSHRCLDC